MTAADDRVSRAAWRLLAVLTLLNVLNFVDRQLIAALAPLLIAELGLTRAQIGLLAGFAFVLLYTLVGLVLGAIADRADRLRLIALGLTLWSGMTALSGLARSFVHLAAARVLVGIGEATLTPAALSILGDVFPARRLATATGVYYAGIPLGTALSLIVSGWMAPRYGWRACFYALGVVGLAAVISVLAMPEPPRRGRPRGQTPRPSLGTIVRGQARALHRVPALGLTIAGGTALAFWAAANILAVTWLVEERAFSFARAAFTAGAVAVPAGFLGNLAAGWFADWCQRRWRGGRLWSLVVMTAVLVPIAVAFVLMPVGSPLFFVCWFFTSASTTAWFGPVFAVVQELAPPQGRSTTVAVGLLTLNLLGVGPGAWITGMIGDAASLTRGLLVAAGVELLAVVPLALAARRYDRDRETAAAL